MRDENAVTGRSVRRALGILRVLAENSRGLGVTELAERSGLAKGTVHLLLKVLEEEGFTEQDGLTRRYRLGREARRLGVAVVRGTDLREIARSHLGALCDRAGMPAYLATLVGDRAVLIEKAEPLVPLVAVLPVGTPLPFHSSALGKVLACHLAPERQRTLLDLWGTPAFTENTITDREAVLREWERVRREGLANDEEESLPGLSCVAAPVRDGAGAVVAAISVAGPSQRVEGDRAHLAALVREAARGISLQLGWQEHQHNAEG